MIEMTDNKERLVKSIDAHNERTEEIHKKSVRDLAENMADDLYKPLSQLAEGRDKYWAAFGYDPRYAKNYDLIDWSH